MKTEVKAIRPQLIVAMVLGTIVCLVAMFTGVESAGNVLSGFIGSLGTLFLVLAKDSEDEVKK